jgi:hypothetical protein
MEQYRIKIFKQIHGNCACASSEDTYLERDVGLPFIPFPGVSLKIDENCTIDVKNLYYGVEKGEFYIYDEEDATFYVLGDQKGLPDYKEYVDDYLKWGWSLHRKGQRYEECERQQKVRTKSFCKEKKL